MQGLHRSDDRDEGFSLIEVVVALVLLGAVAAASAVFFTRAAVAASEQQRRQAATSLVQGALDDARAVDPDALLDGRSQAAATAQWNASQAPDKAAAVVKGGDGTKPLTVPWTSTVTLGNETYTVNTLVGICYRTNGSNQTPGGGCTATKPSNSLELYRVIVEVSWTPGGLARACGGACITRSSTVIDPSDDTPWSVLSAPTAFSSTETFDARTSAATLSLRTLVDAGNTDAASKFVVASADAGSAFFVDNAAYSSTNTTGGTLTYRLPAQVAGSFKARYFIRNSDGQVSKTVAKTVVVRPVVADDSASIVLKNLASPTTPTMVPVRNNDIPSTGDSVVISDLTRTAGTCTATAQGDGRLAIVKGGSAAETCRWTYTLRVTDDTTVVSATSATLTVTVAL
ncbi:type IV pilus modification PilV family protein [Kineococcus sp. SYSU DK002]|uniref:type IV pilus modification PilV family protein n=1 Tax=Kineococcus sp. SYSU DK002 TaxID=3383123 RepID=UPI003D7CB8B3